jgi:predicted hydrocarbon binding protein
MFNPEYVGYLESFKEIGIKPFKFKEERVRNRMGDDVSIFLLRDILYSILSLSPKRYVPYIYSWGKYVGMQSARQTLGTLNLEFTTRLIVSLYRMKILDLEFYRDAFKKAWIYTKFGIPTFTYVNKATETFRIKTEECYQSFGLPNIKKRVCIFEDGIISGLFEYIFRKPVNSLEIQCNAAGDDCCEFSISIDSEFPRLEIFDSKYFKKIRTSNLNRMLVEKILRPTLGDITRLSIFQITYLGMWLSSSGAHTLLYWIGRESGLELSKRRKIKDLKKFLNSLKLGFVESRKQGKKYIFTIEECAFCYGSKNLNKRICSYVAGFLSGYMEKITGKRTNVIETKCIANGDKHCEFVSI